MSDGCPRCALLVEAVADAEAANAEVHIQVDALNRALAAAEKRERLLQGKVERHNEQDAQAPLVRACLQAWAKHCYGGKGKPSIGLNSNKADLIRAALKWDQIGPEDICDGFRGLGLLPYRTKYNERSAAPKPGFTRKTDVSEVLRDEERLERFRDYYRRVQSTPAQRLLEQWEQANAVANELFVILLRAQGKEDAARIIDGAHEAGHLFVIEGGREAA